MDKTSEKIYLFHCTTGFAATELQRHYSPHLNSLHVIPLPCSGKLDILYLTKAFDTGADGAVILTCQDGECRHLEGNLRAKKRAQAIDALLQEAQLGPERVIVIQLDDGGIPEAMRKLEAFRQHIAALAHHPVTRTS